MKSLALTIFTLGALLAAAPAQDFTETVKAALAESAAAKPLAVQGSAKDWFFLRKELEHLAVGDLATADLSKANVEGTDPLPVIQKYNDELKALGVQLLLVPVPPKAMIYPEKLSDKIDPKTVPSMAGFYAKLKAAGVDVLDLETIFKAERTQHPDHQLYCATDTHWSPYACKLVAGLVAEKYKALPELSASKRSNLTTSKEDTLEFVGDLAADIKPGTVANEKLPIWRAGEASGAEVKTVESDPNSPVIAMGDSHLLIFRKGGAMLATQGGFIDHLQVGLGSAVEEYGVMGSGADAARVEIARATAKNPDFWTKKKVVVWVFTARTFTQDKWRVLPAKFIKK